MTDEDTVKINADKIDIHYSTCFWCNHRIVYIKQAKMWFHCRELQKTLKSSIGCQRSRCNCKMPTPKV